MTPSSLSALYRHARESRGLSQRQFAKLVGVTHATVQKWERGEALWKTALAITVLERYYSSSFPSFGIPVTARLTAFPAPTFSKDRPTAQVAVIPPQDHQN